MLDPFIAAVDDLMETAAKKAAVAADPVEEARQLGAFLGLSMSKALYLSMGPRRVVDNNH